MKTKSGIFILILSLFLLIRPHSTAAVTNDDTPTLVCFSLNAAKYQIISGKRDRLIDSVAFISDLWAIAYDEVSQDIIIIGERNKNRPSLFFDDLILALKNVEKVSSEDNPGVSIEPFDKNKYSPYQNVVYYGGIENTHFGSIYLKSDLLLKRLSLGYDVTGISGLPSEWDLIVDNQKAGRLLAPWHEGLNRSYFYPFKVRIINKSNCAALLSLKIDVLTDSKERPKFPSGSLSFDYASIGKILDKYPGSGAAIYAKLFTENFEEIAQRHKVLFELRNLMGASGLFASLLKTVDYPGLKYWEEEFVVSDFNTDQKVETISRSIGGVKLGTSISGKITTEITEVNDVWSELVLTKDPKYLHQAAIASRTGSDFLSWQIPLGYGFPREWPDTLLHTFETGEKKFMLAKGSGSNHNAAVDREIRKDYATPVEVSPGWETPNDGNNLLEIYSNLIFSYGGFETYSPSRKYPIRGTDISLGRFSIYNSTITAGAVIGFEYVHKNKISIGAAIPFTYKLFIEDRPVTQFLLGISDNIIALAGGFENPIITNEISLYNGIAAGRRKYPSVSLRNTLELPLSAEFFNVQLTAKHLKDEVDFVFSPNELISTHSINSITPISNSFSLALRASYLRNWDDDINRNFMDFSTSLRYLMERSLGIYLILNYGINYRHIPSLHSSVVEKSWQNQGHRLDLSVAFPKKSDFNTISFGYYFPQGTEHGGQIIINFDFSGNRIFNKRKWY